MKVVITDYAFDDVAFEQDLLREQDLSLEARRRAAGDELVALVADADCVITQFAAVNRQVVQAMRRARAIVRYGIGVDNVDLDAARAMGIPVCNVPDYCIDEVADHTLAFILSLTRGVVANSNLVTGGQWGLAWPIDLMLALKTLKIGVIGFGRIGREVCRRLVAFKARVLVYDPLAPAEAISQVGCEPMPLERLLAESDLITLHCPSTTDTRRMINRDSLARTKKGLMLVNVGRGDLVDPDALVESLQSGQVRGAALDVWSPEPIPADHPLLKMSNVVLSSHVASVSPTAVHNLRSGAVRAAVAAAEGELPPNIVNGVNSARRVG